MEKFKKKFTTVFLADSETPKSFLLLKRASSKKFAPDLWTGLGGAFEGKEISLECAKRGLLEETGIANIEMRQLGVVVVEGHELLYQFFGVYDGEIPLCSEGVLHKVEVLEIFKKDLIPTARVFLEEWAKRGFRPERVFSVLVDLGVGTTKEMKIKSARVVDGFVVV